ncbi:hypothetical protein K5V21_10170 [Clostridium sardiniense]|uniref:Uncharacterized protein n=1 Tax=Clostridium sardiniense TaxID=29369 RepID=A0ABS7KYC6_CLOSR|nr:hypothetical protein [Clostridium sardiniense]MBY0755819.1 hypothetical protein [Clostridium sardiniense]MDQ0459953.1 phage shock protein A [Clostridium sardiniense]
MEILKKLNLKRNASIKKYEEIVDLKKILDDLSLDFSNLLDKLSTLETDIEWINDICSDYDSKVKLAVQKGNIHLAKKALEKKITSDIELNHLYAKSNYLSECKSTIHMLLKELEDEYDNLVANYESKLNSKVSSSMKIFSNIESKLKTEFSNIEKGLDNLPPPTFDINIDEEIKKYL